MTDENPKPRSTQEIDENLRRVFKRMEQTDLPDRLTDLLDQLRASDATTKPEDAQ